MKFYTRKVVIIFVLCIYERTIHTHAILDCILLRAIVGKNNLNSIGSIYMWFKDRRIIIIVQSLRFVGEIQRIANGEQGERERKWWPLHSISTHQVTIHTELQDYKLTQLFIDTVQISSLSECKKGQKVVTTQSKNVPLKMKAIDLDPFIRLVWFIHFLFFVLVVVIVVLIVSIFGVYI